MTTVGEVTQLNTALRFGANSYYDVYTLEARAEAEEQKLRNKLRAKSLGSDASLDALSRQIIALQLEPNVDVSPLTVRGTKQVMRFSEGKDPREGLAYVAAWNAAFLASEDLGEAMSAFFGKRPPSFRGR